MTRLARLRRHLFLSTALASAAWTLGAPALGDVLHRAPAHRPHGAARAVYFCHLG